MFSYYLRLALASIRRTPVLSGLMVLALGLGIGAIMTTFTVYYLMSGDPIPHKSDVLFAVQLDNWDPNDDPTDSAQDVQPQLTYGDGNTLMQADSPALRQVHMYATGAIGVPEDETPPFDESVRATWHTFFVMFDVPFLYGQPWTLDDDDSRASVAIARALAGRPRFLLADEPTGNLDSEMATSVMNLLKSINDEGTTIVMVTHDPDLARQASRNIHILDGRASDITPDSVPNVTPLEAARV